MHKHRKETLKPHKRALKIKDLEDKQLQKIFTGII